SVIQGKFQPVEVYANDFNYPVAGFDLLISYDNSALSLQGVDQGAFLDAAGWEYFQYRFGPFGNCGNGCPSGMVRIVALAEINDGNNSPKLHVNSDVTPDGLATMNFLVSNDRTLECQFVPIKFYWLDCGDNAFSSVSGDSLFVSRRVYDYNGSTYTRIDDPAASFPGIAGIGDSCLTMGMKGKVPIRNLDLWDGGIRIICGNEIDARGDLNLNGIAYEIADAVMYTNYFIQGLTAFGPTPQDHQEASIAASDANADGITLSVADLVYLIRVVVGDALPYPKAEAVHANFSADDGVLRVPNATLGAAYLVLRGQKAPELLTNDAVLKYQYDSDNDVTRVLVTIPFENTHGPVKGFSGDILRFDGTENDVVTHEFASIEAGSVIGEMVPTSFKLDQNYPNPFNPTTTISFALPQAGDWHLTIYNIAGQVVQTFEGTADGAQYTTVNWDASNVASGVYFYRVVSGSYSATKKAVLLK
ncbi:MAG: T9SS C-terminal target domain-containing protein, partial [Candidatus Zixiibacteriota bacterium]